MPEQNSRRRSTCYLADQHCLVLLHRWRVVWIDIFLIGFLRYRPGFGCAVRIYRIAQFFRRLEERNSFSGNVDLSSSFGVAARSGITLASPKTSKTTNLDFVTGL